MVASPVLHQEAYVLPCVRAASEVVVKSPSECGPALQVLRSALLFSGSRAWSSSDSQPDLFLPNFSTAKQLLSSAPPSPRLQPSEISLPWSELLWMTSGVLLSRACALGGGLRGKASILTGIPESVLHDLLRLVETGLGDGSDAKFSEPGRQVLVTRCTDSATVEAVLQRIVDDSRRSMELVRVHFQRSDSELSRAVTRVAEAGILPTLALLSSYSAVAVFARAAGGEIPRQILLRACAVLERSVDGLTDPQDRQQHRAAISSLCLLIDTITTLFTLVVPAELHQCGRLTLRIWKGMLRQLRDDSASSGWLATEVVLCKRAS